MNVSPLDLRQQRFRKAFRGFDKVEVTSFLAAVADDYEQALRETDRLRQDLTRMEAMLSEHREHEKNLQATMMTAQKLSDDIRANAEVDAGGSLPARKPSQAHRREAEADRICCSRRRRRASKTSSARSTA